MRKTFAWTLAFGLLLSMVVGTSYGQTAQSVLNKMIEAMGGRKTIEAVKDMTSTGTIEMVQMGMTAPITICQKEPNKMRVDLDLSAYQAGLTFTQAYDGIKAWGTNQQTMAIEEMSEDQSKEFARQAIGNVAFLNPQKLGITYALKPKATLDGKDYLVLEQTLADGHKTTMFVDPETYLIFKSVSTATDPTTGGLAEIESFVSDYRKVGGMMVPFSARNFQGGTEIQRFTFSSVTFNTNLDDSLFIMK